MLQKKSKLQIYESKPMSIYTHHIFVCENVRSADSPRGSCGAKGSSEIRAEFKNEITSRGLKTSVRANASGCLDQCEHGCVVVVYPEAIWYARVTKDDVKEIVESHVIGGKPVERLLLEKN